MPFTHKTITGMCLSTLLSGLHPAYAAPADTVWQWTDAGGQIHFSDTRPVQGTPPGREFRIERQPPKTAAGLRPGERDNLREMERQRVQRRQQSRAARQRTSHATAMHRNTCRSSRDKRRSTRDREQRKHHSGFLRKNCW